MILKFGGDLHLGGDNVDDRIAAWLLYLLRGGKPEALERILDPARYPAEAQYTILQQLLTHDVTGLRGELRPEDRGLLADASPRYDLALDAANPESLSRIQKLKALAEKAKMDLTVFTVVSITHRGIFLDDAGEMVDVDLTLDRVTFNRLIGDFVSRTMEETSRVLAASGLAPEQIDRIILIGGSTRMPIIHGELKNRFSCPVLIVDPELTVARGAALKARQFGRLVPSKEASTAEVKMQLGYPCKTSDERIQIMGVVVRPSPGSTAYLSRDGQDLAEVPIEGDRFLFERVPLVPNASNRFHMEIADAQGDLLAEADLTIVHDERAVAVNGLFAPRLTKPILTQGIRGFKAIFPEGEALPAQTTLESFRGTDESIVIPFYEGERWLTNLVITDLDPNLPEGSPIDIQIVIGGDYTGRATAKVRTSGQEVSVDFEIPRIEIPSIEDLDHQLEDALKELGNNIAAELNPEMRARLSRQARKLEASYRRARVEPDQDKHHLYTLVGELRKLLFDVREAHDALTPPREDFDGLLRSTRELAGRLDENGLIPRQDALDKIAALERSGCDAWERQDAEIWKAVIAAQRKLRADLARALQPPPPDPGQLPPERLQAELLAWLGNLRARLEAPFGGELYDIERSVRLIDLKSRESAREELLAIAAERLKPLDFRIARFLREQNGKIAADGSTGASAYF